MTTTQQLVQLMQLEERARTCTNRAEARLFIADAEAAKRKALGQQRRRSADPLLKSRVDPTNRFWLSTAGGR